MQLSSSVFGKPVLSSRMADIWGTRIAVGATRNPPLPVHPKGIFINCKHSDSQFASNPTDGTKNQTGQVNAYFREMCEVLGFLSLADFVQMSPDLLLSILGLTCTESLVVLPRSLWFYCPY